mmetsp:Transcript_4099/g.4511  ORF Transcript_4099/g.4511 Transcript_4099/m.4511 type:complete len:249 (+) Transcript_4099:131-877(+)|eukprot:CAMPEP_0168519374 /NCGR_PEP_ID=MMETSP0405-20121227/7278_1 /TAXON_ID=498012 /ORGANISM="Trichosphaerium sp, Strain Am-I-7 wt" /LENGTH=248 /DNA_ID=CAMNT_0008539901 /DNA_START=30 /DNA_END=776 /DNA_ORIENTATION=-
MNNQGLSLFHAVSKLKTTKVKKLIHKGADVNERNKLGLPLISAFVSDDSVWNNPKLCDKGLEILQVLLTSGVNVDARTLDGLDLSPLALAAMHNNHRVIDLILASGTDGDARDNLGHTPLHWAAKIGCADAIAIMLKRGCDPLVENNDGASPLKLARLENKEECVTLLERAVKRREKYEREDLGEGEDNNDVCDEVESDQSMESLAKENMLLQQQLSSQHDKIAILERVLQDLKDDESSGCSSDMSNI